MLGKRGSRLFVEVSWRILFKKLVRFDFVGRFIEKSHFALQFPLVLIAHSHVGTLAAHPCAIIIFFLLLVSLRHGILLEVVRDSLVERLLVGICLVDGVNEALLVGVLLGRGDIYAFSGGILRDILFWPAVDGIVENAVFRFWVVIDVDGFWCDLYFLNLGMVKSIHSSFVKIINLTYFNNFTSQLSVIHNKVHPRLINNKDSVIRVVVYHL